MTSATATAEAIRPRRFTQDALTNTFGDPHEPPDQEEAYKKFCYFLRSHYRAAASTGHLRGSQFEDFVSEAWLQLNLQHITHHERLAAKYKKICCLEYQHEMKLLLGARLRTTIRNLDLQHSGKPRVDNFYRPVGYYIRLWQATYISEGKSPDHYYPQKTRMEWANKARQQYREWYQRNRGTYPDTYNALARTIMEIGDETIRQMMRPHTLELKEAQSKSNEDQGPVGNLTDREAELVNTLRLDELEQWLAKLPHPEAPRLAEYFQMVFRFHAGPAELVTAGFSAIEVAKLPERLATAIQQYAEEKTADSFDSAIFHQVIDEAVHGCVPLEPVITLPSDELAAIQEMTAIPDLPARTRLQCRTILFSRLEAKPEEIARWLKCPKETIVTWIAAYQEKRLASLPPAPPAPRRKKKQMPAPHTTFVASWRGDQYLITTTSTEEVNVTGPDGEKTPYKTIHAAARAITGRNGINGFKFFKIN